MKKYGAKALLAEARTFMSFSSPPANTHEVNEKLKLQSKVHALAFFDDLDAKIVIQKFGQDVPIDECLDKLFKETVHFDVRFLDPTLSY